MGPCLYCGSKAPERVSQDESPSVGAIFVCEIHWKILQNPKLAMNLMKANIAKNLRGKEVPQILEMKFKQFEQFVEIIRTKNSKDS